MGTHLLDGEFQSDKYPTTPRGFVPLKITDKAAQPLLWAYAQAHRAIDADFSADLEEALKLVGYTGADWQRDVLVAMGLDVIAPVTLCIACEMPLRKGDKYYADVSGGFLHADCTGPEREGYVGADGEPLKDGEPIPEPMIWTEEIAKA